VGVPWSPCCCVSWTLERRGLGRASSLDAKYFVTGRFGLQAARGDFGAILTSGSMPDDLNRSSMQDAIRKQSWVRVTLVVIALAAAVGLLIAGIRRSAARRKLREAILAELQPIALKNCTLKRFGSANDGGYLMCENLIEPLDTGYSYGVGINDDWGCEVS